MKRIVLGLVVAVSLLASSLAYAQNGFGLGAWWMDGDDTPMGMMGANTGSCLGLGTPVGGQGLGLGLGYGDGTQPRPQDGTGFGSPWMR